MKDRHIVHSDTFTSLKTHCSVLHTNQIHFITWFDSNQPQVIQNLSVSVILQWLF